MEPDQKIPTPNATPPDPTGQHKVAQTFADDMASVIGNDQGGGLVKKIIQGEELHEEEKKNLSTESTKNKFFMFVGLLLLVVGVSISVIFFHKSVAPTVPIATPFTPLVFTDKSAYLPIDGFSKEEIVHTILNEANTSEVKIGGVEGIYLTLDKKVVGFRDFATLLKLNFVPESDALVSDNFLMGVVNDVVVPDINVDQSVISTSKDFFILMKVKSVPEVFSMFGDWENKLFFDLHSLFGLGISSETETLLTKDFTNGIIENKNARILYQDDNVDVPAVALMYVFADDHSVVLTNARSGAKELMMRLASSQVEK